MYRQEALETARRLFEMARGFRTTGEEVAPMAFFFVPQPEGLGAFAVPMSNAPSKDFAAAFIRQTARESGAEYVYHVTEAWSLPPDLSNEQQALAISYMQAGGSLSELPFSVEVIFATIDGSDLNAHFSAVINDDGSIGETQELLNVEAEGRFCNFTKEEE